MYICPLPPPLGSVTLTDEADGVVIADAVMFHRAGDATANSVTWNPNLSSPGHYEVYARWTAHPNRASNATYTVHHAGGETPVAVDQRANGGTWNLLGTFDLDPASTIELTDAADGYVIGDAIRLVRQSAPPPASPTGIFYVHTDHLGTPKVATDAAQGIAWAADYLPYGQAQITAEAVSLNVRFPGQYFDAETGLHYNYLRDYDPSTGRYIEGDRVGLLAGLNLYAYAANQPLLLTDRLGLQAGAIGISPPPPAGGNAGIGGYDWSAPFWPKWIRDLLDPQYRRDVPGSPDDCDDDEERCKKAGDECFEECEHLLGLGGRTNQGHPYRNCWVRCMKRKGCYKGDSPVE